MPRPNSLQLTALFALGALGCSFEPKAGAGAVTNPNGTDAGAGVDRIFTTQDTSGATGGDGCPSNAFTASNLPPDLLIVLDRSGSMKQDSTGMECGNAGCGANSKWTQMTTAINQVVGQTEGKIRWGLKYFATMSSCGVNAMAEVPVGPMNAAAIAASIARTTPGSSTPTRAAETQAAAYLSTVMDPNPKYILLATDGQPNCASGGGDMTTDDAAAIAAVQSVAAMGFPTFVIGIATNGMAEGTLNMMAINGGHPRAMAPQYYPVATSADLAAALGVIQGMVALPCQFQLGGVPSDLGAVSVTVGGMAVSQADWTYGPGNRSIIFPDTGAICTGLKSGSLKDVVINLPCGATIIP